jgi:hypothetical protein
MLRKNREAWGTHGLVRDRKAGHPAAIVSLGIGKQRQGWAREEGKGLIITLVTDNGLISPVSLSPKYEDLTYGCP